MSGIFGQFDITTAEGRKAIRVATHLLDDPAPEVAQALLDRIEELEQKLAALVVGVQENSDRETFKQILADAKEYERMHGAKS